MYPTTRELADFEEVVVRYRSKVYGLALRMMKDPDLAEEMLQETFLAAWQNFAGFRGDAAIGSWLYRICTNCCLMSLRRRKMERGLNETEQALPGPHFDPEGNLLESPSGDWVAESAEDLALTHELRRAIEGASAALPDEHRAVFLLRDVSGLSYEEIAETVGSTVPAVKSRLHRARLALRQAIQDLYEPARSRVEAPDRLLRAA